MIDLEKLWIRLSMKGHLGLAIYDEFCTLDKMASLRAPGGDIDLDLGAELRAHYSVLFSLMVCGEDIFNIHFRQHTPKMTSQHTANVRLFEN